MDTDKIEVLSEQLLSIAEMWEMLLNANSSEQPARDRSEELLLELLKKKQKELHDSL